MLLPRAVQLLLSAVIVSCSQHKMTTSGHFMTVTVLEPKAQEDFLRGSNLDIKWQVSDKTSEWVHIYLMRGSNYFTTLVGHTANDGAYSWFIPPTFRPYEFYRIAIAYPISDKSDEFQYSYSPYFKITVATNPPTRRPTPRPTRAPTPKPSHANLMKHGETLLKHDETLMKTWYAHNKQDAAVLAGGVAGLVVILSFYSLMTAISNSNSSPGYNPEGNANSLGEASVLMGKRGSTDV